MSHAARILFLSVVVAGTAACSDGVTNPGDAVPATLTRVAGDSQTVIVKSAVAVPPAVLVENAHHRPVAGVTVTFTARNGGSVSGANAKTDSLGVATAGTWVLGSSAGRNVLIATVADVDSVAFTATGIADAAARLAAVGGDTLLGTVGAAIPTAPAVQVGDAYGNPVPGVTVTFAVSSGGGSATGTASVTDSLGVASVGSWTLGTVAGTNTMTATVSGFPTLNITAIGRAGPPAGLTKQAGDGQGGGLASPVDSAPSVLVTDGFGNPVQGTVVTFTVITGGGSLSATPGSGLVSVVQRPTNETGIATVGAWVLGSAPGINTLAAAVTGLPEVTFTATAQDGCAVSPPSFAVGSSVEGALSTHDCRLPSGEYTDLYSVTVPTASSVRFDMMSTSYYPDQTLFDASGALMASGGTARTDCTDGDDCSHASSLHVLLAPGDYIAGLGGLIPDYSAEEFVGGGLGPYSFSSTVVSEDITDCEAAFVTRGVTTAQRIDTTDCAGSVHASTYFYDQIDIYMTAGQTYTISMSSAEFDTYLELWDGNWGDVIAFNDDFGGSTDSQITFTPTQSGRYVIAASTYKGETTGTYTLVVQ
jgi:hypothetical protein